MAVLVTDVKSAAEAVFNITALIKPASTVILLSAEALRLITCFPCILLRNYYLFGLLLLNEQAVVNFFDLGNRPVMTKFVSSFCLLADRLPD